MTVIQQNYMRRTPHAFTLIELLMVFFVISLLLGVAVPTLARFSQTSKVQQAAVAVDSALFVARSMAQEFRTHVAVFYGDDLSKYGFPQQVVPTAGTIEVWGVRGTGQGFGGYGQTGPYPSGQPNWFPFMYETKMMSQEPLNIPEGIRIIAGDFTRTVSGSGVATCTFGFPYYQKSANGEIKRHHSVFCQRGGMVRDDTCFAYNFVLIFDTATGEHVVMEAGRCQGATRPRILPWTLTHIGCTQWTGLSEGATTKITDFKKLEALIDQYKGDM